MGCTKALVGDQDVQGGAQREGVFGPDPLQGQLGRFYAANVGPNAGLCRSEVGPRGFGQPRRIALRGIYPEVIGALDRLRLTDAGIYEAVGEQRHAQRDAGDRSVGVP